MELLKNERGIALTMVLVLSAISLAVMAALLYMVTAGTQLTGMEKRYNTALEAGKGGKDIAFQFIGSRGNPGVPGINLIQQASNNCLTDKLTKATANWTNCGASSTSLTIDPSSPSTYDIEFTLGNAAPNQYKVTEKIVDTVEGNSGPDTGLVKNAVVLSVPGEITVMSIPYLYTIEIDSENLSQPADRRERAKLSVLYEY
ncbi:MAG TPA: hypothetical protein VEI96_05440 [Thermodesulfovibrionales bacterium]|nr:hypothetical protein [Thermodesulfovibrionales bacterium]